LNVYPAPLMVNASTGLVWSFVGLALAIASTFIIVVHRVSRANGRARQTIVASLATATWLAATLGAATAGVLSFSSRPPTMLFLVAGTMALAIALASSRLGLRIATGIPLAALVGFQGFRFPLELMLHQAYVEGLMPIQMSFNGFNFDILTGVSAILVSLALVWKPESVILVRIWNTAGVVLLVNILTIAILSAPTPFRTFHAEPANVWITQAPWVWLPSVYVLAAIAGHILVYRRLRVELARRTPVNARDMPQPRDSGRVRVEGAGR
jgi:hypothetical protein